MIHLQQVSKLYRTDRVETTALDNINLEIGKGEFISVMGPSGCGKSTLARCIVRLLEPTSGALRFRGDDITHLNRRGLAPLRRAADGGPVRTQRSLLDYSRLGRQEDHCFRSVKKVLFVFGDNGSKVLMGERGQG